MSDYKRMGEQPYPLNAMEAEVDKLRAKLKWFEEYYKLADEVMSTCIDASRHENTLQEVEKVLQFEERNPKPE
jgi:hypothetical protein